jgi:ABC-type transporter Mla subunit MlaD
LSEENGPCIERAVVELTDLIELLQSLSPELQEVVRTLPKLPDEVKNRVAAMVKTTVKKRETD